MVAWGPRFVHRLRLRIDPRQFMRIADCRNLRKPGGDGYSSSPASPSGRVPPNTARPSAERKSLKSVHGTNTV